MIQKSLPDFTDASQWNELQSCPLCGHSGFHLITHAPDRYYGNPGLFRVVGCPSCGLNFLNPMPTLDYLSTAYPSDYYAYQPINSSTGTLKRVKKVVSKLLFLRSANTRDPKFEKPGTMLDVGCGAGEFLAAMRKRGWEVRGAELNKTAAERGQREGLDIFAGTVLDAKFPPETFDYVRSNHSFEHIHNPREVLLEIHRILKPSGRVFIGVPNVRGLMARIYGSYWWYLGAPVHPFGYSPATLSLLLKETGFQVDRVNFNSNSAGIFGSLQIYLNRNNGRTGEDGAIARSRFLRLVGGWIAALLDGVRQGDCIEVIARPV